jgi:hypothetical protein
MYYQMPADGLVYITAVSLTTGFGSEGDWIVSENEGSFQISLSFTSFRLFLCLGSF